MYILLLLLAVWFGISFVRTIYNISKVYFEEKQWVILSTEQKKEKIYTDTYTIVRGLNKYTPVDAKILLISDDGKQYFYSRYLLYPREIYWDKLEQTIDVSKYAYIIVYKPSEKKNYSRASFAHLIKGRNNIEIKLKDQVIAIIYK